MMICCDMLVIAVISLFLFGILDSLLLLLDFGSWFLLSSYDDKKGEKWMLCIRGSYSEFISLDALCEGELMLICSIFFLSSIYCFVIIKKGENVDLGP